ncbi:MAG: dihydroorotate dehydrogenase electron transfer subunit [Vicinamibacteria bacterium]
MELAPKLATDREAELVSREPLGGAFVLLTFRHPDVAARARAGQFVMIKAGTSSDPPLRRPFSIMRVDPARDTFSLFLKVVGQGSRALAGLEAGGVAACLGPLGQPFGAPPARAEPLLVAGGYGVAPFVLFCEELQRAGQRPRVFYGGRTQDDLVLRSPFTRLGVPLLLASEDGSVGVRGRVTAPLEAHLDAAPGPFALFACGPDAMLQAVADLAARRGLPARLSLDPWMGCGVGTCLGCVVRVQEAGEPAPRYRCACTEGPIFDADVVVWPGAAASRAARRHGGAS